MNALLIRPGEKIEETDVAFTQEFFKEFFGDVETGACCFGFFNFYVYFTMYPTTEPPNFTLFDMVFYGNVLITGVKPDGTPRSLAYEDSAFVKRYIKAAQKEQAKAPKKRINGCTICDN